MFKKNIATIKFISRFMVAYIILTASYDYYLNTVRDSDFILADEATLIAAAQSSNLVEIFGFESSIFQNSFQHSINFIFDGSIVMRIIEGCNGVSVAILFIAFVLAFKGALIDTLIYIPMGLLLICSLKYNSSLTIYNRNLYIRGCINAWQHPGIVIAITVWSHHILDIISSTTKNLNF
jgi:exosortase family protein XrtF